MPSWVRVISVIRVYRVIRVIRVYRVIRVCIKVQLGFLRLSNEGNEVMKKWCYVQFSHYS
jgi:hypothetical protein